MHNHYFKQIAISGFILFASFFASVTQADFKIPSIDDQYIALVEENPSRDAGYVVGDKITRTITLTIQKPYELVKETLPIVGYEHRYRGQKIGIELADIQTEETSQSDSTTHKLMLTYQVFTTSKMARPAALRAEFIKLRNLDTKKVVQYRIPSWSFRTSPLSVFGAVKLDKEMSPFIEPLQIDKTKETRTLNIALAIMGLALLGLLYILGVNAWLPWMGAPFAKAYRDIRKMSGATEEMQQAVTRVHNALNKTAGTSVFDHNLADFIAKKPQFAPAQQEIAKFFELSRFTFFEESGANRLETHSQQWLLSLCRHLRDCERGLTPNIPADAQQD